MSTCSKMYMMKVLTWGSRPTVNSSGKHKMNTERRRAPHAVCIQWCYNCINGHPLLTPNSQHFWLSNNGFTDPRFQWAPWLQIASLAYLSTHTVYWCKMSFFSPLFWGDMAILEKWIQENIIFMRFCCCFKLSKKTEKLLNEQLTHIIAKCTRTGLVQ